MHLTKQEPHSTSAREIFDEGSTKGYDAKAQCSRRKEPTRSQPFAKGVRRDLKQNVGDVENRENAVVVVASELEVLLEAGELRISCVWLETMSSSSKHIVPMFARSMKQNRYNSETVGTVKRSIFRRSLRSASRSNSTIALPYLRQISYHDAAKLSRVPDARLTDPSQHVPAQPQH